jgi:hydrogenase expression/formation protein HypE
MAEPYASESRLACPVPHSPGDRILLAHGEGARLTRRLIREEILAAFDNEFLRPLSDGAVLPAPEGRLVLTTDGSVVSPLFFPGGDVGRLAVHAAVNDLAVCGAQPLYLSLGLIVEEGLPTETLRRVLRSAADAARRCGVPVVTGDTKVVPRGAADQLFLNTTGVGRLRPGIDLGPHRVRPGDRVLVSGTVGDHGLAVLAAREGLGDDSGLSSDTAPLHDLCGSLLAGGAEVHFLRDPTRGGVSAVLHELAEAAGVSVTLDESAVPLSPAVRGACELLGLDPLYVANEGKLLAVVAADTAARALACLRAHPLGASAALIGEVGDGGGIAPVLVRGALGGRRVLDEPSGAPLPRIC